MTPLEAISTQYLLLRVQPTQMALDTDVKITEWLEFYSSHILQQNVQKRCFGR